MMLNEVVELKCGLFLIKLKLFLRGEKTMPTDDETLKRDKLLLDLMIHAYDEDVSRNELIDSKNCQMIVLCGMMLTLQATLFTEVLVNHILTNEVILSYQILTSSLMILSVGLYLYAMILFINAYAFNEEFWSCPAPDYLLDKAINDVSEFDVQGEILATMSETIELNKFETNVKIGIIQNKKRINFV